jgi:hypothetical protein
MSDTWQPPPLPEPGALCDCGDEFFYEAQLRAYGAASFRAGMERAAAICEQFKESTLAAQQGPSDDLSNLMLRQVGTLGFGEAAAAIRKEAGNG